MSLALRTATEIVLSFYPEPLRGQMEEALPELLLDAARVGLEVMKAEHENLSFAEAVRRPTDFPLMNRIHFGFIAILQWEVPAPLVDPVREMCLRAREYQGDDLSRAIFAAAALDDRTWDRACLRFVIYQLVRATAWAQTFHDPLAEVLGCHRDLDDCAEEILRKRMAMLEMFDDEVRPLDVVVREAMEVLLAKEHERLAVAWAHGPKIMDTIQTLLSQAAAARHLPAPRAQVLRNRYAPELGDEHLGAQQLADRYPDLYPSAQAVWQHSSRLDKAIHAGDVASRRPRLIDLLRDGLEMPR